MSNCTEKKYICGYENYCCEKRKLGEKKKKKRQGHLAFAGGGGQFQELKGKKKRKRHFLKIELL